MTRPVDMGDAFEHVSAPGVRHVVDWFINDDIGAPAAVFRGGARFGSAPVASLANETDGWKRHADATLAALHGDGPADTGSPLLCEHANESARGKCQCDATCAGKTGTCGPRADVTDADIDAAIVQVFKSMHRGALTADAIWDRTFDGVGRVPTWKRMSTRIGALVESGVLTMTSDDHGLYSDVYRLAEQWKDGEGFCVLMPEDPPPAKPINSPAVLHAVAPLHFHEPRRDTPAPRLLVDVEAECADLRETVERLRFENAGIRGARDMYREDSEQLRSAVVAWRDAPDGDAGACAFVALCRAAGIDPDDKSKMAAEEAETEIERLTRERNEANESAANLQIECDEACERLTGERDAARSDLAAALSVVAVLRAEVMDTIDAPPCAPSNDSKIAKLARNFRRAWETESEGGFNLAKAALFAALDDAKA